MGDCRLRVLLQRDLIVDNSNNDGLVTDTSNDNHQNESIHAVKGSLFSNTSTTTGRSLKMELITMLQGTYSADTTIREIRDILTLNLQQQQQKQQPSASSLVLFEQDAVCCFWDCTCHPPKDVTDWFTRQFTEVQGPHSKTLYDAGWFPSGTLQILGQGVPPQLATALDYDDAQYNIYHNVDNKDAASRHLMNDSRIPTTVSAPTVQWQGGESTTDHASVLPSQILNSVKDRWNDYDSDNDKNTDPSRNRFAKAQDRRRELQRKEEERCRKLHEKILQLETKHGAVAQQVRRMLIKSRAKGRNTLAMDDRVYLHCVAVGPQQPQQPNIEQQQDEQQPQEENADSTTILHDGFYFFSRQDTMGKIVETLVQSMAPPPIILTAAYKEQFRAELIIQRRQPPTQNDNAKSHIAAAAAEVLYRRLPNTTRLYEAMADHWIQPFDSIVIRCYLHPFEQATTSILEDGVDEQQLDDENDEDKTNSSAVNTLNVSSSNDLPSNPNQLTTVRLDTKQNDNSIKEQDSEPDLVFDSKIAHAIRQWEEKTKNSKAKKSTATSSSVAKVRSMLIKSRAKGDAKRIPKMEDRFYLELIVLVAEARDKNGDNINNNHCQLEVRGNYYVYMAKTDTVERIVRDCLPAASAASTSSSNLFYVPVASADGTDPTIRRIQPLDLTFQGAERNGIIHPFDRIIVIQKKN